MARSRRGAALHQALPRDRRASTSGPGPSASSASSSASAAAGRRRSRRRSTSSRPTTSGTARLQTRDAGATLDQWATLVPLRRGETTLRNVFDDCANWWALARQCLVALDALHALGFVHLDLKPDNVCIPWAPAGAGRPLPGQPLGAALQGAGPDRRRLLARARGRSTPSPLPLLREPGVRLPVAAPAPRARGRPARQPGADAGARLALRLLQPGGDAVALPARARRRSRLRLERASAMPRRSEFVQQLLDVHNAPPTIHWPHRQLIAPGPDAPARSRPAGGAAGRQHASTPSASSPLAPSRRRRAIALAEAGSRRRRSPRRRRRSRAAARANGSGRVGAARAPAGAGERPWRCVRSPSSEHRRLPARRRRHRCARLRQRRSPTASEPAGARAECPARGRRRRRIAPPRRRRLRTARRRSRPPSSAGVAAAWWFGGERRAVAWRCRCSPISAAPPAAASSAPRRRDTDAADVGDAARPARRAAGRQPATTRALGETRRPVEHGVPASDELDALAADILKNRMPGQSR